MSMIHERNKPPHLQLPNFEPLPPDKWQNRLINGLLRPFFYLFFTLITSIIVVPVFTIIENIKKGNRAKRGAPHGGSRTAYTVDGQSVETQDGSMQHFLRGYGNTYHSQHDRTKQA